jgi:hypothetical protein
MSPKGIFKFYKTFQYVTYNFITLSIACSTVANHDSTAPLILTGLN